MAPIQSIMLSALLAISMTSAVPLPDGMSHTPLPPPNNLHPTIAQHSHWWNAINGNHYRHPVKPFHPSSTAAQVAPRQNSAMGRMAAGAVQGFVSGSTTLFSDYVADTLTGNDRDHPQKSKEELEKEKAEEEKNDE